MNNKRLQKVVILISILLLPSLFYLGLHTGVNNFKRLPIMGPKKFNPVTQDTVYHTIPSFSFVNQNGDTITDEYYEGKIYVADFFFATCPTICPKMATNMGELQKHFYDRDDFKLLSHTVNPSHDSVAVLREYADQVYAMDSVWNFVTGNKDSIYSIAFNGYFANAMVDDLAPGGFLHTSNLILVDKQKRIRGVFDGTSLSETNDLMDAIEILYREQYAPLKDEN